MTNKISELQKLSRFLRNNGYSQKSIKSEIDWHKYLQRQYSEDVDVAYSLVPEWALGASIEVNRALAKTAMEKANTLFQRKLALDQDGEVLYVILYILTPSQHPFVLKMNPSKPWARFLKNNYNRYASYRIINRLRLFFNHSK